MDIDVSAVMGQMTEQTQEAPQEATELSNGGVPNEMELPNKENNPTLELIAKLERKVRAKEEEVKNKEKSLQERLAKLQEWESEQALWKSNPLEALKMKDLDISRLNEIAIQNMTDEELDPVQKEIKMLKEKLGEYESSFENKINKALEEREKLYKQKENEMQLENFKSSICAFLSANKDKYELSSAEDDAGDVIYDIIEQDMQKKLEAGEESPEIMTIEEAAEAYEKYLDQRLEKLIQLKKVKSKLGIQQTANVEELLAKLSHSDGPRTIEDNLNISPRNAEMLSEEERVQAAIDLLKRGF